MWHALSGFGFLTGATYPFRSLAAFKRNPSLGRYLIVPILLNVLLGSFFYWGALLFGWQVAQDWVARLFNWVGGAIANLPAWLGFVNYLIGAFSFLLHGLLIVVLLLLTGLLFAQFGVLLGAPWYGQLSEELEKLRTGQVDKVEVGIFQDFCRAILYELKKLVLIAGFGLPLLPISLLPGIGPLAATVAGLTLSATIVCLDFLDAPLERRRLRFRDKLAMVFKSLPASAGFSLACLGLVSIPLLNLLTIPLCVASGTLFFCDRVLPKLPPKSNAPNP